MTDERSIDKLLTKLARPEQVVAITQNKKPESAKNFDHHSDSYSDGFWTRKPSEKVEVNWGVHYRKGVGTEPSTVWAGHWLPPKQHKEGKWIFRADNVQGPFLTSRSFFELFGVHSQTPFVYLKVNNARGLKAPANIGSDVTKVQSQLALLQKALAKLPLAGDDISALAKRRLGHGALKQAVHELFDHHCCMSGIKARNLLVCSHIKPWSKCRGEEKVAPDNTLLLSVNWDAVFDRGLISFGADGSILLSPAFTRRDAANLGIDLALRLPSGLLTPARKRFLAYHRERRMLDKEGKRRESRM